MPRIMARLSPKIHRIEFLSLSLTHTKTNTYLNSLQDRAPATEGSEVMPRIMANPSPKIPQDMKAFSVHSVSSVERC